MAQARADAPLSEGYRLDEFTIRSVLGRGGFGITYLAQEDPPVARRMAIKEYLPWGVAMRGEDGTTVRPMEGDKEIYDTGLERFAQEAGTLARFRHPNIVEVHRFLRTSGTAYLIMLYEDGDSLETILKNRNTLSQAEIDEVLYPLLDGLQAVHKAGFLHRDIKPDNIYIRKQDGSPVLLDFGAARQTLGLMTQDMTAFITLGYSPFEQYSAKSRQGPWTDIYALAATLYRAISGQKPPEAIDRLEDDELVPAVRLGKGKFREGFLGAIDQALAVRPQDRPQSIGDWRAMLENEDAAKTPLKSAAIAPTKNQTFATGMGAVEPPQRKPQQASTREAERRPMGRRIASVIAAIVVVAALGASGYWGWVAYQDSERLEKARQQAKRKAEKDKRQRAAESAAAVETARKKKREERKRSEAEAEAKRKADAERKRREAVARGKADEERRRAAEVEQRRREEEARRAEERIEGLQKEEKKRRKAEAKRVARARAAALRVRIVGTWDFRSVHNCPSSVTTCSTVATSARQLGSNRYLFRSTSTCVKKNKKRFLGAVVTRRSNSRGEMIWQLRGNRVYFKSQKLGFISSGIVNGTKISGTGKSCWDPRQRKFRGQQQFSGRRR